MRDLELFNTDSTDHLLWASAEVYTHLDSPAASVFADLDQSQPMVLDVSTKVSEILDIMDKTHTYMRMVVDRDNNFVGIITQQELLHRNLIKLATLLECNFNDLLATDIMVARNDLLALDYQQTQGAKVSDIVELLQKEGLHHLLVIDHEQHHIRGLVSAKDIARRLKRSIDIHQPPSLTTVLKAAH